MQLSDSIRDYIRGSAFHKGLRINLAGERNAELNRDEYLMEAVRGKRIIHMGFMDHLPLVEKKIGDGTWLHARLLQTASRCVGIDIDAVGMAYVTEKFGISDLYCVDVSRDPLPPEILEDHFDVLLVPDVLEHIGNPVAFLRSLSRQFSGIADAIIVTVPYAFRLDNFLNILRSREVINSDHRFWFTPYTLCKILFDGGMDVHQVLFMQKNALPFHKFMKKLIVFTLQLLRDTLVVTATWSERMSLDNDFPDQWGKGRRSA